MLKIIQKPSPLMQNALANLKSGAKKGERLAQKTLKNGSSEILFADKFDNLYALDKVINTPYRNFVTRFIYDGEKLKRWNIIENTPIGNIKHKILNSKQNSSGEMRMPDKSLYLFSGIITNPKNIVKYGRGQKVTQEEFLRALDYIRHLTTL